MLEVLYHHAKFGGAWISPATGSRPTRCTGALTLQDVLFEDEEA